jgi:hypothetical protein
VEGASESQGLDSQRADGYTMPPAPTSPKGVKGGLEGFATTAKKLLTLSEVTYLSSWCGGGGGGVEGR